MSSNNIPLEGRTRLPGKIQDCIQDCGLIASHIQTASRSNELLGMAIKNFASLDSTIDQSSKNLRKVDALLKVMDMQ
uniref:BLOC-1-related complex subunit 7 n=1 Tax=Setaria digitata TaxID=48799 RepID=A0A915PHQ4_9BILA